MTQSIYASSMCSCCQNVPGSVRFDEQTENGPQAHFLCAECYGAVDLITISPSGEVKVDSNENRILVTPTPEAALEGRAKRLHR